MDLHELFYRWINEYSKVLDFVKRNDDYKNPFRDLISKDIPEKIVSLLNIREPYSVVGSYGKGRWTDVPWVAVFDERITKSAQKGVYIVYLLNKDSKTLYLTLEVAATEALEPQVGQDGKVIFTGIVGKHDTRLLTRLQQKATDIRNIISSSDGYFSADRNIDSGSDGYDSGAIYYKKYALDNLPSESDLSDDLRKMMILYKRYYEEIYKMEKGESLSDWEPSIQEYTPGLTKEEWLNLLNNPYVFTQDCLRAMAQYYAMGGAASCMQLSERFGKSIAFYRTSIGVHLASRVVDATRCPVYDQENSKYWPVLFVARKAASDEPGSYIWKLRNELMEALTEFDIMKYLDGGKDEVPISTKDLIAQIESYIASKGFTYESGMIENFYLSLKSKPFVILAGTSGTGKTRLVRLFAEAVGATSENGRYLMVPVRPDWSDSSDLFGHVDLNGRFVPGAIIDFVKQAELNPDKPYFLCLDEMNLARVEYYLSDILSVIETRDFRNGRIRSDALVSSTYYGSDSVAAGKYGTVTLPENLYLIGTVNMDETTFPFSRKVLDRANTIEFSYVDLMPHFRNDSEVPESLDLQNNFLKSEFLHLSECAEYQDAVEAYCEELQNINRTLQQGNAHVGYRVRDEIIFYLLNNRTGELLNENMAMDNEIMQKILPRIQGSSSSVKKMLCDLFKICAGDFAGYQTEDNDVSAQMMKIAEKPECKYRKSALKIAFMVRRFEEDGFTSYWL